MSRALHKLTALSIKNLPPGKHSDGGGLWLNKRNDGGSQWFLRVTIHGKRREMGLGSGTEVSLKEARSEANKWRDVARSGKDPIKERERLRRVAERNLHLLRDVAVDAFESHKASLKDDGKAGRWFSPLELHVLPKLGAIPVSEIDQIDIRDTLKPIWHTKASTAQKALERLGICLRHASALNLDVDLQTVEKAKILLGKQKHKVKHIPAMAWQDVPEFYSTLQEPTPTHLALRLLILTAVRSTPVRYLKLENLSADTWVVPKNLMKSKVGAEEDFSVPLSTEAQKVVELAKPFSRDGYLFPSPRKGVLSDATMARLMERQGLSARPHGFRSSFKDWCAETTDTPEHISEVVLAHSSGSKVLDAYRRTQFLDLRRPLMEQWAQHVTKNL
ncbi:tyrosine-type recombinase/integrase [Ruegeria arenilitoris]|uniref:tyrosine-type recombinase/integrase n=1 Tax=Ruegeria arenilitoris TaxID=1173585 RepID=UPI00147F4512|nr:integrase arm-type DNA-binding domain-containing protein [Ruegeria arenilitoris]